jgi:hypothetical protein
MVITIWHGLRKGLAETEMTVVRCDAPGKLVCACRDLDLRNDGICVDIEQVRDSPVLFRIFQRAGNVYQEIGRSNDRLTLLV